MLATTMRRLTLARSIVVAVSMLVTLAPATPDAQDTGTNVRQTLRALRQRVDKLNVPSRAAIFRSLSWLDDNSLGRGPVNDMMRRSLQADLDSLADAETMSREALNAVTKAVADDLAIKVAYCDARSAGMNATVEVSVRTWRGKTQEGSWGVAFITAPLAILHRDRAERFPAFSSPTKLRMAPGRYVIWAQDPADDRVKGRSVEITVGDSSPTNLEGLPETRMTVDVLVPDKPGADKVK